MSDIACSIGDTKDDVLHAQTVVASRVHTRTDDGKGRESEDLGSIGADTAPQGQRVFMVGRIIISELYFSNFNRFNVKSASRVHCNIAFGELVVNFPEAHINEAIDVLMPALLDILNDVPFIDFDKCVSWQGMSLFTLKLQ